MPRACKQEIEEKHGNVLTDFLGFKCTLERGIEPAPDLLFTHEGRKIGLDHTRLFAEDGSARGTQQEREKLFNSITDATRLEYLNSIPRLPPIDVQLYISRCRIKKAEIKALARQTVEVVIRNLPDNSGRTTVDNIGDGRLPAWIDSIRIFRFPEQTPAFFSAPRFAWMRTIDSDYLQRRIDEKATRLHGYLRDCNEAWLLIVEEGNDLSNTVEMPNELWKHAYDFRGFTRVFVLRGTDKRIIELVGY